jgi:FkbM family methyltransferase
MFLSKILYYLSSIPTILMGIRNWPLAFAILARLPTQKPNIITLRKLNIHFIVQTPMDVWIIKEVCLDDNYEMMHAELEGDSIIIDIGAGLGDFSIYSAKHHPHCKVYAFEPFPQSFTLLQENFQLNNLTNVQGFQYAIGASSGTMKLHTNAVWSVQYSTVQDTKVPNEQMIEVQALSFDRIMQEFKLSRCDFLKIDCEGGEFDILFNICLKTLRKIKYISVEYHNGVTSFVHDDLINFFQINGFDVRIRKDRVHPELGTLYATNSDFQPSKINLK